MTGNHEPATQEGFATRQLPLRRPRQLVGRDDLLVAMYAHLERHRTLVLQGAPGCGATALAIEYFYRHVPPGIHAWYVRCHDRAQLTWDYVAIRGYLDVRVASFRNQADIVASVRNELSRRLDWIIVFDDVASMEDLEDFLPENGGRVIIVAKGAASEAPAHILSIPLLADRDIEQLMRAGRQWMAPACEGRPLAAYLADAWAGAVRPEADWQIIRKAMAQDRWMGVLETCCVDCRTRMPDAWQLLTVLACFNHENVPKVLLREGLPFPADEARQALTNLGLVVQCGEDMSLPSYIQATVHRCATAAEKAVALSRAIRLLCRAFPRNVSEWQAFARCAELVPHVRRVATLAEAVPADARSMAQLQNRAGLYLVSREQYGMARPLLEAALRWCKRAFGKRSAELSQVHNNLGLCLRGLGDLNAAMIETAKAYEIAVAVHGADHPAVGARASNAGLMCRLLGRPEEACSMYRIAYESMLRHEGRLDPRFALRAHNYGQALRKLGAGARAKRLLVRALCAERRIHGPDHPRVAFYSNALGELLIEQNDPVRARRYVERARAINMAFYGDNPLMPKQIATDHNLRVLNAIQQ